MRRNQKSVQNKQNIFEKIFKKKEFMLYYDEYYVGSSHLPNERCERSHNVHRSLTFVNGHVNVHFCDC